MRAVLEDRGGPHAATEGDAHLHGAEVTTRAINLFADLVRGLDGQADEDPAVGAPGIPCPQLSIDVDDHNGSITRRRLVAERPVVPMSARSIHAWACESAVGSSSAAWGSTLI